jgi:hypothetical protein
MLPNILISGLIYLSWTLFVYSHDNRMVTYLLQCDTVSLKVIDNLQKVTHVLCLYQPSIILLSVLFIHTRMFVGPS